VSEISKIKAYIDLGEPGLQYVEPKPKSFWKKLQKKLWKRKEKTHEELMTDDFFRMYGKLKHYSPRKKSLWEKFKDLFKREYKKKEIFNKDGELDVKALMSNFKNKKKEPEVMELSELTEGYIHAPYLPITQLPFISPPTMMLDGKPSGMTELKIDTEETYEDK
jgi:hypothetical protein